MCPDMSIFLSGALYCLGTCTTLVCLMVVALEGWHKGSVLHMVYAPVMHFAVALTVGDASFAVPGGTTTNTHTSKLANCCVFDMCRQLRCTASHFLILMCGLKRRLWATSSDMAVLWSCRCWWLLGS